MKTFITSKKYTGVQYKILKNGDKSYYITYKVNNHFKREHIGKKSEGITENFCYQKRNEAINRAKFGDDTPTLKYKKADTTTVDDLAQIYFKDKAVENKANKKQEGRYNLHLKNQLGSKSIHRISKDDILQVRKALIDAEKAPKTVNGIIQLLSAIFNYAIKEKDVKCTNPCSGIKRLKVDDKRERFLSQGEIQLLKSQVMHDRVLNLFVHLSLITGGRLETIMSIQKKDINIDRGTVTLKDHKSGTTYTGFLDRETIALIAPSLGFLQPYDYLIGESSNKFPTRTLQRKLRSILNELFNQGLAIRDSKNRVVIHTLRHTFASQLAIAGTPIFTIQKLMNHADIQQTMRYAKLAPNSGKESVLNLYSHTSEEA